MNYPIEDGIPIPPVNRSKTCSPGWSNEGKYPFRKLEVGQSFAIPATAERTTDRLMRMISGMVQKHARKTGKKFVTRQMDDVLRVWRVE